MTRNTLINLTINTLSRLPRDKIEQVNDFAEYILKKHKEEGLQKGIENLTVHSGSFDFLNDEEELYSYKDLKERYW